MKVFNPELVLIQGTFLRNKSIATENGVITEIGEGDSSDKGAFLPGLINAHSHAFQRGLRGRGETFKGGADSFWGWRDEMYSLVNDMTIDSMFEYCKQSFAEMRAAGVTTVGEFHYLHHNEKIDYAFDNIVIEAAKEIGIRLVLLHACYLDGGVGVPLTSKQARFDTKSVDAWWEQVELLKTKVDSQLQRVGVVAHSLRAVNPESIALIANGALQRGMPLHIHVEEQRQEIEACIEAYGKTPMAILNDSIDVSPMVTAVHCTHTSAADMEQWLSSGGNVCLCPLTEANLADGVCDLHRIVKQDGCVSLGTDSNVRISMLEEMRWMEYVQRLMREERGVCITRDSSMAHYLVDAATKNGARCLGIQAGEIEVGKYADFTVIDLAHAQLKGCDDYSLLTAICCGADNSVIKQTIVSGVE